MFEIDPVDDIYRTQDTSYDVRLKYWDYVNYETCKNDFEYGIKDNPTGNLVTFHDTTSGIVYLDYSPNPYRFSYDFFVKNSYRDVQVLNPIYIEIYFKYLCTDTWKCVSSEDSAINWFSCKREDCLETAFDYEN